MSDSCYHLVQAGIFLVCGIITVLAPPHGWADLLVAPYVAIAIYHIREFIKDRYV